MRRLPENARSARARDDCSPGIARCATPLVLPCNFPQWLIPLRPGRQNVVGGGCGSVLEQITNTTAFGDRHDGLSALPTRVPTALRRRGGLCSISCRSALA